VRNAPTTEAGSTTQKTKESQSPYGAKFLKQVAVKKQKHKLLTSLHDGALK